MSPDEYVAQLEMLVGDGLDAEALDLATRLGSEIAPRLDAETFFRVSALLEGAELAVSTTATQPKAAQPALPSVRRE